MKIKLGCLLAITFILCLSVFVQATIEKGNLSHEILEYYGAGAQINGWVNVSVVSEDSNILFKDYFDNSIELLKLIKNTTGIGYSCVPIDCQTGYTASSPETSKTIQMTTGSSSVVGFKIDGTITKVNSIDFVLKTDAAKSCDNQIAMDFFVDENIDFSNNKSSSISCPAKSTYGCFSTDTSTIEFSNSISSPTTPYCQRIILPEAPAFEMGAWVKKVSGNAGLTMWLNDEYGDPISEANCELPEASTSGGEISCTINYLVKESKEYFVCLTPGPDSSGSYKVKGYTDSSSLCGFYNFPSHSVQDSAAYQIFAKAKKFEQIGTVEIKNIVGTQETLGARASDYLEKRYGNAPIVCPAQGCIIPVKIFSNVNQKVELQSLSIIYDREAGGITDNKFFTITESVAKVSTDGFQKFTIENANFFVGSEIKKINYTISLGSAEILKEEISIEAIPVINKITPMETVLGFPTSFKVNVSSPRNISSYFFDFGDGFNSTSRYSYTSHTYNASGTYTVISSVKDSDNRTASRSFSVVVNTPEKFIEDVLNKSQSNLENIDSEASKYPVFYKDALKEAIHFIFYEKELVKYKKEWSESYGNEAKLFTLTSKLLNFSTPKSISVTKEAKAITFYPQAENINLAYLVEATGGSVPADSQKYIDAILGWNQESMDIKMDYTEFFIEKEGEVSHLISFFKVTLEKLKSGPKDPTLIINQMEGLSFESKTGIDTKNTNYATTKLSEETTSILFSTTMDVDFKTLPLFVSVPIEYIPLGIDLNMTEPESPKWIILILILILLIIIAIISYIVMQIWYKKKYEKYLFPNKTDLYNLTSFVQTARDKGTNNSEIRKKLLKSGWGSERVTYAMKKHSGKRTGMIELPGTGFISGGNKKNKEENGASYRARPKMRPRTQLRPNRRQGASRNSNKSKGKPAGNKIFKK